MEETIIEKRIGKYQKKLEKISVALNLLATTVPNEIAKGTIEHLSNTWDELFLRVENLKKE